METGVDILYAWVSRMVCFGLYEKARCHLNGLSARPNHGTPRPEDEQEQGQRGQPHRQSARIRLRRLPYGHCADEAPGVNRPYDESKLIGARNFCNKLWNIARYTQGVATPGAKPAVESPADHWIISHF